jgi:hypothetical protein
MKPLALFQIHPQKGIPLMSYHGKNKLWQVVCEIVLWNNAREAFLLL